MPEDKAGGRFGRLGRRLMGEDDGGRSFRVDAREVLNSVLEGGDKAKTEVVKVIAREVRTYFEELGLKDDLHHLLTNYSFEVRASINLRKLTDSEKGAEALVGAAPAVTPTAVDPSETQTPSE
ncbi:MAG: hypothetical protein EXR71_11695 [Myxococcales bacterium]|nr:hypothetical protein [Myxococcales bacterium]